MDRNDNCLDVSLNDFIRISQRLNSCVDFISFYSDLEGLLFRFGYCSKFSVIIYYDQLKDFYLEYSNLIDGESFNTESLSFDGSVLYECFTDKKPVYVADGEDAIVFEFAGRKYETLGCEPLLYRNQIFGMILFHKTRHEKVLNERMLHVVSNLASTTIINLQLYQETNQEASENAAKLWAISSAGELLSHMDLDTLLVKVMELVLSIVSAQVGSIMIIENDELSTKVEWGLEDKVIKRVKHSSGVPLVEYVFHEKEPFLTLNLKEDDRINDESLDVEIESLLSIPLYTASRNIGVVNIINSSDREKFSDKDIDLLVTMTNLVSISIENALLYKVALERERIREQLNIAHKIQQDLMPSKSPELDDYCIDGVNLTCDETGGDYYDYFSVNPEKHLNIIVGDVSGHGIAAALFMATARVHLRTAMTNIDSLSAAMEQVNTLLIQDMETNDKFITIIAMTLDLAKKKIRYISAGHETGIVYRESSDSFIELHSTGLPLGLIDGATFEEKEYQLQEGDVVLLYTDGIKEAMNNKEEMFGFPKIKELLKKYSHFPVDEIKNKIFEEVETFCQGVPREDDWTVVVLKVKESPEGNDSKKKSIKNKEDVENCENNGGVKYLSKKPVIKGEKLFEEEVDNNLIQKEIVLDKLISLVEKNTDIDNESEEMFNLRLCLDEAMTNSILHGNNGDDSKKLYVALFKEKNHISFLIKDEGEGFDANQIEISGSPPLWELENGRGVYLIGKLMDEVVFFDGGASIFMKKTT